MTLELLSIDPGEINFAFCRLRINLTTTCSEQYTWDNISIIDWNVISTKIVGKPQTMCRQVDALFTALSKLNFTSVNVLVIECQLKRYRIIEHTVCAFFRLKYPLILIGHVSSRLKLQCDIDVNDFYSKSPRSVLEYRRTYTQRKEAAIRMTNKILDQTNIMVSDNIRQKYRSAIKQDDYVDSLLQGLRTLQLTRQTFNK